MADGLMERALSDLNSQQESVRSARVPQGDLMDRAMSELSPDEQVDRNIFEAPAFAQRGPLKVLTGIGQELAETAYKIPKLFGADIGRPPQAVETGFPEKLGAGAVEYGLGGAALKAIAPIQKAFETLSKIPKVGKMLAPIAQRAAGAGVMGAVERPEEPLKGAEIGAALSPLLDLGLAGGSKLLKPILNKLKLSPTLLRKPVVKEFNALADKTASKLGLKRGQDVEKAAFNKLSGKYEDLGKESSGLYGEAEKSLEGVPYSTNDINRILDEEMATVKNSADPFDVAANRSLKILKEKIKNPAQFLRQLNKEKRTAYKAGNFSLIDPLEKLGDTFEEAIRRDSQLPGNEELVSGMAKLKKASDFFKKNIVPLRQRGSEMTEYGKYKPIFTEFFKAHSAGTSKGFLKKTGSNIQDLEHLSEVAPEMNDYFALSEFKKGFNEPDKTIKSFKKLSDEQKNIYYKPEQLDRLEKFSALHDENPEIFEKGKRPLPFEEVPFLSMRGLGISALPKMILSELGKTPMAREALESDLKKTVQSYPILSALTRGGTLRGISPTEERR